MGKDSFSDGEFPLESSFAFSIYNAWPAKLEWPFRSTSQDIVVGDNMV